MTTLQRLVCVSRNELPAGVDPHEAIAVILDASRRNNARNGVSGARMFGSGVFAQVLEGELHQLEETFFDAGSLGGDRVLELLQWHLDEAEAPRRAA